MTTRNDEEKYLDKTVATYPGFSKPFTYANVLSFIGSGEGQLSLEMVEKEAVRHINNSDIKMINETMRFLLKIIEKPRMFIKTIEEKVPIDQAKRINYQAIAKLSRDSNDWYSRTLVSVKPKQIYAEVTEDTLDIYENRFIVTLFDLIHKVIYDEYNDCLSKIKNAGNALALDVVSQMYTGYNPNWSFADVCSGNQVKTDSGYRFSLKQHKESLEILMRRITLLKTSELYTALRNKKRLTGNVQKTNILMFDQNYNRAYKLWLYLHENHYDDFMVVKKETIPPERLVKEYQLYCFLGLCICLNKIGLECKHSPTYRYGSEGLTSDGVAVFSYGKNELEMGVCGKDFRFRYRIINTVEQGSTAFKRVHHIISDSERETIDEFWFCPRYDDLEELSQMELMDYTTKLFNELTPEGGEYNVSGRYAMLSINLDAWGDKGLGESISRRLFNSGDNLSNIESKENLERWSDFKTGIALVSAYPFRGPSGLNKVSKILYNHLLKPKLKVGDMKECPICSGRIFSKGIDAICSKCNIRMSYTYCKACDPDKQKPFFWIKYKDDSILENEEVMETCETTPLFKMDTISQFMPKCTLTSFDIDADRQGSSGSVYKFRTICPRCGIKLGDENEGR